MYKQKLGHKLIAYDMRIIFNRSKCMNRYNDKAKNISKENDEINLKQTVDSKRQRY